VWIESDRPCYLVGYEVNSQPLRWLSPPPALGKACTAATGLYFTWTTFDIQPFVHTTTTGGTTTTTVDWAAIRAGKAVVRLANGQLARVGIYPTCVTTDSGVSCASKG
jgi:hypothetical protein